MNLRPSTAASVILALLLCTGCSSLKRPTTSLRSASLGELSSEGVGVNFDVAVSNPNGVSIPLRKADYRLAVGKAKVLDGKVDADTTIPANGTKTVTVPVHVTFEQLLAAQSAIRSSGGNIPYTFSGTLDFANAGLGIPVSAPFEFKGELPLRKILSDPATLLSNPAARDLAKRVLGGLMNW